MPRSTGGPAHARKRKRVLRRAKGFVGMPGHNYRPALEFIRKADVYAYRDRRQKKRHFRQLWIVRLNAALRERGISYNRFIPALALAGVELNRKILSDMAVSDIPAFDAIVEKVRPHIVTLKPKAAA
ncbi:MAG: 50S ribosomal protein L20 [Chthoniobacterales bacterium]|nr:50S ribosomal protein L20 [Chthoniobacterales bacterium]